MIRSMTEPITGGTTPLKPLAATAWGLLLVVLDLRIDDLDLLPDPVGWLVVLLAVGSLSRLHRAFAVAAAAAALGLVASVPDWMAPGQSLVAMATSVAETVLVFATCTGIMSLAPDRRASANAIRWWDLGLSVALVPVLALAAADPAFGVAAVLLGIAALVVLICFVVLLFRTAGQTGKTIRNSP